MSGYGMHNGLSDNSTVVEGLQKSMQEETLAAQVYRERARAAADVGDTESLRLWLHIADEEDRHYHELARRLHVLGVDPYPPGYMHSKPKPEDYTTPGDISYTPSGHYTPGKHRPFPMSYSDWLELVEDIKVTDGSFETQTKVNNALRTIGDRDSDPPDVSAAERYLMAKAHELHID